MEESDIDGLSHDKLVSLTARCLAVCDKRAKQYEALRAPKAGRPRKNGFDAPEGDLDREVAGDA
jgi:hypothetical protein